MSDGDVIYKTDALIAEDIAQYLEVHQHKSLLRFITCGSVDDGKSTLIGRLLYDSKMIFERSDEHTSELPSLMRNSYAVFCLKEKTSNTPTKAKTQHTNRK